MVVLTQLTDHIMQLCKCLSDVTEEVLVSSSGSHIKIKCFCSNYLCTHRSWLNKSPSSTLPELLMHLICYDTGKAGGDLEGDSRCVSELAL